MELERRMHQVEVNSLVGAIVDREPERFVGKIGPYTRVTGTFFFQAEDGIRDLTVTGVQTCALPILPGPKRGRVARKATWPRSCDHWQSCSPTNPQTSRRQMGDAGAPKFSGTRSRASRSEEHTSELQSQSNLVCRLLLEQKKTRLSER